MILIELGPVTAYRMHAPRWAMAPASGGYDPSRWAELWEEFHCDWRELWFNRRVEPPSWVLADEALAAGAKGILFQSGLAAHGTNLVVYDDMLAADDTVQVYDPAGALPKNQESWR